MTAPFNPKDLEKLLPNIPFEGEGFETFTYEGKGHTLVIREPAWREIAIGVKLMEQCGHNPMIAFMALLPMVTVSFDGVAAIDVAQVANLPKEIYAPVIEQLTQFFLDSTGGVDGGREDPTSLSFSDERADLLQPAAVQSNATTRTVKAGRGFQPGAKGNGGSADRSDRERQTITTPIIEVEWPERAGK